MYTVNDKRSQNKQELPKGDWGDWKQSDDWKMSDGSNRVVGFVGMLQVVRHWGHKSIFKISPNLFHVLYRTIRTRTTFYFHVYSDLVYMWMAIGWERDSMVCWEMEEKLKGLISKTSFTVNMLNLFPVNESRAKNLFEPRNGCANVFPDGIHSGMFVSNTTKLKDFFLAMINPFLLLCKVGRLLLNHIFVMVF